MRREVARYLQDIVQACERLQRFLSGCAADDLLRSATERQFEIIGEALNQLLKLEPQLAQHFTNPGRIVAFRNLLIHQYGLVDNQIVWGVASHSLPLLYGEVSSLLEEEG